MTNEEKVKRHAEICEMLTNTYQKKNHDYGDSFHILFMEEGYAALRIRLSDKLNRFKTLTKKAEKNSDISVTLVTDESITDTVLDLANYAIMTFMELEELEKRERMKAENEGIH